MSDSLTRRELLKTTGRMAAAATLAGLTLPRAFAGQDSTVQLALVGCGGRGTGAIVNALSTTTGPTKLVAMADVFDDRLQTSFTAVQSQKPQQVDVPEDRKYIGFDAYKKAMDCLRPGDVVILTTPPAFRWVQFAYAIERGLNVFMEKPITVDGPSTRRMLKLGEESLKRNLKVGVGLMCRHCVARGELYQRVRDGQMGDLLLMRAYRMVGPTASGFTLPRPPEFKSELLYQIKNFHSFLWASGGGFSDFLIHNIDECCWIKGANTGEASAWPVEAKGTGGRHYRGNYIDQNFDSYTVEYTFRDGTKMMLEGRLIDGCHQEFASYAHGTKGAAVISISGHHPAKAAIYKGQRIEPSEVAWAFPQPEPNPYQLEWDNLITAIREDKPHNEVKRGAEASLVTAMGRMSCHTGRLITFDEMLNCEHEFAPDVDKLTLEGPAPIVANAEGKYPVPQPGIKTKREY